MTKLLGELEQDILYAVVAIGDGEAYGVEISREIERRTGRRLATGAVYTILRRREERGLVRSEVAPPTPERGGRRKKLYHLEAEGIRLLAHAHRHHMRMTEGLSSEIERLLAWSGEQTR